MSQFESMQVVSYEEILFYYIDKYCTEFARKKTKWYHIKVFCMKKGKMLLVWRGPQKV